MGISLFRNFVSFIQTFFFFYASSGRHLVVLLELHWGREQIISRYFDPQCRPFVLNEARQTLTNDLGLILESGQLGQKIFVIFTLLTYLFLKYYSIAVLLSTFLWLHLVLFFLFRGVVEVFDLAAKILQSILCFLVTALVQVVALSINFYLDIWKWLGYYWLNHEKNFAEADRVL